MTRKQKTVIGLTGLLGAAALAGIGVANAEPDTLTAAFDALLQRPAQEKGTVIVPERFLRPWDPVTIFFTSDRGPRAGGAEAQPQKHVTMSPGHPGAWEWLDGRTLQFRPAEPWPPLATYDWRAAEKKVQLTTLMQPPSSTQPSHGSRGLDPVDSITITLPGPVREEVLARMVSIELRRLPGVGGAPFKVLGPEDYEIKTLERTSPKASASYVFRLHQPIGLGTHVTVSFRLALRGDEETTVARIEFGTAEPFRVTHFGCAGTTVPATETGAEYPAEQPMRCSGNLEARVAFSSPPKAIGPIEGRNLVRFEPGVEGMEFSLQGSELVIRGDFEREQAYRMALVPTALSDRAGRALEMSGRNAASIWFPRREPYLRWQKSYGVVEAYGPKHFPLQGRRDGKADLRVYAIDPLNRSFWPFPDTPISVDEAEPPPGPGEEEKPWDETYAIGTSALRERLRQLGTPGISTIVELPLGNQGSAADFGLDLAPHLGKLSGRNVPGHYLVGLRRLDNSTVRSWVRVQVTDLSLTAVEETHGVNFVVTSLKDGTPVAGAQVAVEGRLQQNRSDTWTTHFSGTTDGQGVVHWDAPGHVPNRSQTIGRIVVKRYQDVLVLNPNRAPQRFYNNHWGSGSGTWLQWVFSSLSGRGESATNLCHVFTERPIYRPEEKVHIKGYARTRHHGRLTNIVGEATVVIDAPGSDTWRLPVELTGDGSFYVEWDESEIPTGTYRARFEGKKTSVRCTATFSVEAYRLPKFEVKILGPDVAPYDRPFEVKTLATYYAGGEVVGRPVRWRVTQYPYTWQPKGRPGFLFSSDGRFSRAGRFDATPERSSEDETNSRGESTLVINPSIEPTAHPRTYSVESTITGADGQTVTSSRRFNVVPAFVIGMKLPRYLERATAIEPEIILVGPDSKAIAGQELTLRLKHRQWHSYLQTSDFTSGVAKYVSDVVDVPVLEQKLVSTTEVLKPRLPIERAGVYLVEIEAQDKLGRAQVVTADLYAGGDEPVTWKKAEAGVFNVAPSQKKYRPGDKAALIIQSPYQEARALVVVETPTANRYSWLPVRGGKATFNLSIEEGWVPRLPVHVVLMRGRTKSGKQAGKQGAQDLDKPVTVASTAWLMIEPVENIVEVKLEHPEKARPGQTIPVTVKLADPNGKPLAGEVTLWLVDQAILALKEEARLDPLPDFITARSSYLHVRDTRNAILGRIPFAKMPGGDEGEEEDSPLDKATVRKNFQPVPYYNPTLRVGRSGVVKVNVALPDNLTVFKMRAKAISGAERFGVGTSEVAVRLPLLVQPALPRFVRPGDTFAATAIGRVVEGEGGAGAVEIKVDGLEVSDKAKRAVTWKPKEAQPLSFSVRVPMPPLNDDGTLAREAVKVTMGVSRKSDGATDAFMVPLPLRPDRRPEVSRELMALKKSAKVPKLPEPARPGTLKRSVVVSSEAGIVRLAAALDTLRQTPMHCTKQRLDRARAYLGTVKLRDRLGMAEGREHLAKAVNDTLLWLDEVIDRRGLVANWPGNDGQVSLTATALQFLVEAEAAGFRVDRGVRGGLARRLSQALRSDYRYFISGESWFERTTALQALASHGSLEQAYFSELSRRANYLSNEGIANVALAAHAGGKGGSSTTAELVERLKNGITLRLHQGREIYAGLREGRTDRSPFVLPSETRTLSLMTRAINLSEPKGERLPILVSALVGLGDANGWGSTDADSAALLALSDRLLSADAEAGRITVSEGGKSEKLELGSGQPVAHRSDLGPGEVSLKLDGSLAEAIVLARTQYLPEAPGDQQKAHSQGFVIERNLLLVQADGAPPKRTRLEAAGTTLSYTAGDVIEEHLRVVNPKLHHYVAISIPLAAGMEPLNPSLATAPPEATPSGRQTKRASYAAFYDDSVTFYFDELPKGTYDFYFRVRAMVPGSFIQPAAIAELLFDASVRGNTPGARIAIAPKAP